MNRYTFHPLILCVLGLSIIGLFYKLMENPFKFIQQFFLMLALVTALFFIVRKFIAHKQNAANQYSSHHYSPSPKTKYNGNSNVIPHKKRKDSKKISRPLVKKRNEVNLTVIEGKKNKKKNRALF